MICKLKLEIRNRIKFGNNLKKNVEILKKIENVEKRIGFGIKFEIRGENWKYKKDLEKKIWKVGENIGNLKKFGNNLEIWI